MNQDSQSSSFSSSGGRKKKKVHQSSSAADGQQQTLQQDAPPPPSPPPPPPLTSMSDDGTTTKTIGPRHRHRSDIEQMIGNIVTSATFQRWIVLLIVAPKHEIFYFFMVKKHLFDDI